MWSYSSYSEDKIKKDKKIKKSKNLKNKNKIKIKISIKIRLKMEIKLQIISFIGMVRGGVKYIYIYICLVTDNFLPM